MCDTLVVLTDDGILFAKNSDRDPNEGQGLEWHPGAAHGPGDIVRCTWMEVPQVEQTHAILISRPFWMWGAEIGANEHGVVIGNEAVFTDQPYAKTGLTGMDMLRLALERAATAREAVDVIVQLLENYGQGGGCGHEHRSFTYHNSFIAADRAQAFVLETAGSLWAVEEVKGRARSISNGLTIPGFAHHADRVKTWGSSCVARRGITEARGGVANTVADMASILRNHGSADGHPVYAVVNGAMSAPCAHPGGVFANTQSTASWIADLKGKKLRHWVTATAAPCTSIFKPVAVDDALEIGPGPGDQADDSLWWRHERLHREVLKDPATAMPRFAADRDAVENEWFADPLEPQLAFKRADALLDDWLDRVGVVEDRRPGRVRGYWKRRNRRAGLE